MGGKGSKSAGQDGDQSGAAASGSGCKRTFSKCSSDSFVLVPVFLNVYQMSDSNPSLPGFGIWHTGVEVNGIEYTFGKRGSSLSGISSLKPRTAPGVTFKETVEIGRTALTSREIRDLVAELGSTYAGNSYHVTGRCVTGQYVR